MAAEKIFLQLKDRYSKARAENPVHLPTGSANPKKIDWIIINKLSFLKEYVSNRPVISSLQNDSQKTNSSQLASSDLKILDVESAHFREIGTIVKTGLSIQDELALYATHLPPVQPSLDRLGSRNKAISRQITSKIIRLEDKMNNLENFMSDNLQRSNQEMYKQVLTNELNHVPEKNRAQAYIEITNLFENFQ